MLTEFEKATLRELIRNRAYWLRDRQRTIECGRTNLCIATYAEQEYKEAYDELVRLHVIFTKLCNYVES